jgi:hypothetical protein
MADIYLHYIQNLSSYLSENTVTSHYKDHCCVTQLNSVPDIYPSEMLLDCR